MKNLLIIILLALPFTASSQDGKGYTIIFLNKKPEAVQLDKEATAKLMEGHLANINRLAREGKLLVAGPFEGGGGIFILNTTSMEEAERWINTDPAIQAKRWNIEILPYTPRIGSICPASEGDKMVAYAFVRFNAIVEKFTASNYPVLIREHDAFVKEHVDRSNIITEAIFGPNDGGILILKDELPSDVFAKDPAVQQGLIHAEMKKLYVAETSFCKK